MANLVPMIFCFASLLFIVIGLLIICSPAARKERYVQTTAIVRSRMIESDGALFPVFEFQADGKINQYKPRFPVSDSFPAHTGDSVSILYCVSSFLGIKTYSVVPDDDGKSLKKLIRYYRLIGSSFIVLGLVLLIPAFLLHKK